MSDLSKPPVVKLDAAAQKRLNEAAEQLEGLKTQAAALAELGIIMPSIMQQIEWAEKAHKTLIEKFT